jgi:hypothetical protein
MAFAAAPAAAAAGGRGARGIAHGGGGGRRAASSPPLLALLLLVALLLGGAPAPASALARRRLQLLAPRAAAKPLARPDYGVYRRKAAALAEVRAIAAASPAIMRLGSLNATSEDGKYGVSIPLVTIAPGGLAAADAAAAGRPGAANLTRVLISFGQHAREYVTVELGLRFLQALSDPAVLARYAALDSGAAGRLQALLRRVVIQVAPMENPNGRDLVEAGALCERKNGRGVDANRNWGVDWGVKEKDYDAAEENPGPGAFSEPETRAVRDAARAFAPHVWLNVHSGMEALFTPYDHRAGVPPGAEEQARVASPLLRCAAPSLRRSSSAPPPARSPQRDSNPLLPFLSHTSPLPPSPFPTPPRATLYHTHYLIHYRWRSTCCGTSTPTTAAGAAPSAAAARASATWRTAPPPTGCTTYCTCRWRSRGRCTVTWPRRTATASRCSTR